MTNRKKLWTGVPALVGCALLARAVLPQPYGPSPVVAWQLASLKLSGTVPEITWVDILRDFIGWAQWPYFAREFVTGDVRLKYRSNFPGCPYVLDTPVGEIHARFADVELVEGILKEILQQHVYEHPQARVGQGDIVLDVGAHLGTFARYAFQKGARVVVGVEPDPRNVACLKQTFREEIRQRKFRLVEAAASDSEGTITLLQHPDSSMSPGRGTEPPGLGNTGVPTVEEARGGAAFDRSAGPDARRHDCGFGCRTRGFHQDGH
jgi:hypothetical protein